MRDSRTNRVVPLRMASIVSGDIGPILDPRTGLQFKFLISLALPRGLEPLFSP